MSLVLTVLLAAAGGIGLLVLFQRQLVYPLRRGPTGTPTPPVVVWPVRTADHLELLGWLAPPAPGRAIILSAHGNAASPSDIQERFAPLVASGIGVAAMGYPGYGSNDGSPDEASLFAAARAFLGDLLIRYPQATIVLHGWSLGSGVATWAAVEQPPPQVAGLILEAPFTTLPEAAAAVTGLGAMRHLILDRFDNRTRMARLAVPLLWLHGTEDRVLPLSMGQALFHAAPPALREAVILPGGDHINLMELGALAAISGFVTRIEGARAQAATTLDNGAWAGGAQAGGARAGGADATAAAAP